MVDINILLEDYINDLLLEDNEMDRYYISEDVCNWLNKLNEDDNPNINDMMNAMSDKYRDIEGLEFDPHDYNDVEEAIEDLIKLANKYKNFQLSYGPMFPEERTYIDLKKNEVEADLIPHKKISDRLDFEGYEIVNYRKGLAKKKNDKRLLKIGRILNRMSSLKKIFDERLKGEKKSNDQKLQMVFSYNPRDIATMSTDRGWTSCADMRTKGTAPAAAQLPNKIRYGGMVVYLINDNDKEIKHPIARIAIRRFVDKSDGTFALLPEKVCYGAKVEGFQEQVNEVLDKNNKETLNKDFSIITDFEGGYSDTYNDSGERITYKDKNIKDLSKEEKIEALKSVSDRVEEMSNNELLSIIKGVILNRSPVEDFKDLIEALNDSGQLADRSSTMISFINKFFNEGDNENALKDYIKYLYETIPEKMKKTFEGRTWTQIIDIDKMNVNIVPIIKEYVPNLFINSDLNLELSKIDLNELLKYDNLKLLLMKDYRKKVIKLKEKIKRFEYPEEEIYQLSISFSKAVRRLSTTRLTEKTINKLLMIMNELRFIPYFSKLLIFEYIFENLMDYKDEIVLEDIILDKNNSDIDNELLKEYKNNVSDEYIKDNLERDNLFPRWKSLWKLDKLMKNEIRTLKISMLMLKFMYSFAPDKVLNYLKTKRETYRSNAENRMNELLNSYDLIVEYLKDPNQLYIKDMDADEIKEYVMKDLNESIIDVVDNLFKKVNKKIYLLSEETMETLKTYELNEGEALVKLQRMYHTAPASEKQKIAKAIKELQAKEKVDNKNKNIVQRKFYKIYGNWGWRKITNYKLDPDTWYSRETNNWSSDMVRTFIYIPEIDKLIMKDVLGYSYAHGNLARDAEKEKLITMKEIKNVSFYDGEDIYDFLTEEQYMDDGKVIHGRTGPFPLRRGPDETDFYASIWNDIRRINKKDLDEMIISLSNELPERIIGLLVPNHV